MPELKRVALVILAAGASKRMGRPKQNLAFRGKTLLQTTIDAAKEAASSGVASGIGLDVFVVLGANEQIIREQNNFDGCEVLINSAWTEGLSSSIRCALSRIDSSQRLRYDAVLFTVADLVFLHSSHFLKLLQVYISSDAPLVCTAFASSESPDTLVYGVPALFRRSLFEELMQLEGDVGAKKMILKNQNLLKSIKADTAGFDVDNESDYLRLLDG